MSPFDFLNSINETKQDLFVDPTVEKDYNAFIVNKGLSYFPDTILFANEMNKYRDAPKKWQYDFLRNAIPKKRRFSKWHKKDVPTDLIQLICKHYKYSEQKAYEVMDLLSPEQIESIRTQYDVGGRNP